MAQESEQQTVYAVVGTGYAHHRQLIQAKPLPVTLQRDNERKLGYNVVILTVLTDWEMVVDTRLICSQSITVSVPSSELGPTPNPLAYKRVLSPGTKKGGHTRLRVRGGGAQFGRLVKKPGPLSTLWGWSKFQRQIQKCDFLYLFLSFPALLTELTSFLLLDIYIYAYMYIYSYKLNSRQDLQLNKLKIGIIKLRGGGGVQTM